MTAFLACEAPVFLLYTMAHIILITCYRHGILAEDTGNKNIVTFTLKQFGFCDFMVQSIWFAQCMSVRGS